jgi:hypothetical protein
MQSYSIRKRLASAPPSVAKSRDRYQAPGVPSYGNNSENGLWADGGMQVMYDKTYKKR